MRASSGKVHAIAAGIATAAALAGCGSAAGGGGGRFGASGHPAAASSTGAMVVSETAHTVSGATLDDVCPKDERSSGCYSPRSLQGAYGVSPLLARHIDGRGRTVVLPEASVTRAQAAPAGSANLADSIAAYDARFDLPAARVSVDTAHDHDADPALANDEEVLDVEMVHAMAPGAAIRVVAMPGPPATLLARAVDWSRDEGDVVSISYGVGEQCLAGRSGAVQRALERARAHGVTVVASAGDNGPTTRDCHGAPSGRRGVGMPGADPLVTSAGGTSLRADVATGAYEGETVWNDSEINPDHEVTAATGGGYSRLFSRPAYQDGSVPAGAPAGRGLPDVAFDADKRHGVAAVIAVSDVAKCAKLRRKLHRSSGSSQVCGLVTAYGGTSVAAPAWAGIAALADQYAHRRLGLLNPALYRIGHSAQYHRAFHDITTGSNTVTLKTGTQVRGYGAGSGWDPVTGWGSPDAHVLVPLLARSGS